MAGLSPYSRHGACRVSTYPPSPGLAVAPRPARGYRIVLVTARETTAATQAKEVLCGQPPSGDVVDHDMIPGRPEQALSEQDDGCADMARLQILHRQGQWAQNDSVNQVGPQAMRN